jgi:hypothetical protein
MKLCNCHRQSVSVNLPAVVACSPDDDRTEEKNFVHILGLSDVCMGQAASRLAQPHYLY